MPGYVEPDRTTMRTQMGAHAVQSAANPQIQAVDMKQPPAGLIDQEFYLAVAKKAAEYSRAPETDKWLRKHNNSLWIALRRLDVALEWKDPSDQGHLDQRVSFTGKNFWEEI